MSWKRTLASVPLALAVAGASAASPRNQASAIALGGDGRLVYASDERGDRIPDFSWCGYAGGNHPIPTAPVRVVVAPAPGDSTARIQAAIDYVAALPAGTNGLRGAVLLLKGRHEVLGGLRINVSGVVLRGQGMDENGTVLVAAGVDRRTLIRILGHNDRTNAVGKSWPMKDAHVPVGARSFQVENASSLKAGDTINVLRRSTAPWIQRLGMTEFGGGIGDWRLVWKPGSRDLVWDRVVESVAGDLVTVDAPITTALDAEYGGGSVERYDWPGRLSQVAVENLRCESVYDADNPKDENHAWFVITFENARDSWVRQVTAAHFAGALVAVYETCKQITVQDCVSLAPVSEDGGYRRHTFFTQGQMTLFLRCFAENGRHDFSVGHCAAGPNAFVQCTASFALGDSGPIESWASGVLYDGVSIDGNGLGLANRGPNPHGAGWAAANSVLWQCSASQIRCAAPPGAHNWAFGCWGDFEGDGTWRNSNEFVRPESLYVAQVADRLGSRAAESIKLLRRGTEESSNPGLEKAAELIALSRHPAPRLVDYINAAGHRDPIDSAPGKAPTIEQCGKENRSGENAGNGHLAARDETRLAVTNGWLVCGNRLLVGSSTNVAWWRGNLRPAEAPSAPPALTRFVPGRAGPGFADDLEELADRLAASGVVALEHNYGLWYDRRRDDHERVRRSTGDVWPPLYELPFARSGKGTAWDGLSRYDLTRYNPWYWSRLRKFAALCDDRGLVLFHQNYFQHNILEAGAHWADFPWRTANNVNNTAFPEPPPYAGDKRIFMAEQFYDASHPIRRELHRAYIRKCLDNFADNQNVIQFTSAEFTGPLSFMEFWLDTVSEWEHETGKHALVALSCTKDVQDAVLADLKRGTVPDLIDFRYWWRTSKGLFAPAGGKNLAPRQFERQWRGGRPTDMDLAGMAAEYRVKYPGKAVICDFESAGWAFVCAGGSLPRLPRTTDVGLLGAIPRLHPAPEASDPGRWVLKGGNEYLAYVGRDASPVIDLETGMFVVKWVDLKTGEITVVPKSIAGGKAARLPKSPGTAEVFWLTKE